MHGCLNHHLSLLLICVTASHINGGQRGQNGEQLPKTQANNMKPCPNYKTGNREAQTQSAEVFPTGPLLVTDLPPTENLF